MTRLEYYVPDRSRIRRRPRQTKPIAWSAAQVAAAEYLADVVEDSVWAAKTRRATGPLRSRSSRIALGISLHNGEVLRHCFPFRPAVHGLAPQMYVARIRVSCHAADWVPDDCLDLASAGLHLRVFFVPREFSVAAAEAYQQFRIDGMSAEMASASAAAVTR
jgi:hypothetical protein